MGTGTAAGPEGNDVEKRAPRLGAQRSRVRNGAAGAAPAPAAPDAAASACETGRAYEGEAVAPVSRLQTPDEARTSERVSRKRGEEPHSIKFFAMLNAGLILTALAIVVFKSPNGFAFGGTSGVSIVLSALVPWLPVGAFMWILNIVLVALGFIFLERRAVIWSAYASFALSAYVSLFELVMPTTDSITGDMWLDLCFAVLLPALGSAIVFDIGASTGGTDILAMILKKRTSLEIGKALMLVDVGIVCCAAVIYGPRVGLYCILGLLAKTMVVDGAIESLHLRKVCTVICKYPLKVEEFVVRDLNRTATVQYAYGAYTGKQVTMIMSVLTRKEAMRLRLFVRKIDPNAFITIVNSSEIIGRGFRGVN